MKNYIFLFIMMLLLTACDKDDNNPSEIKHLGYGTSFGMCVGYCSNTIWLKSGSIIYSRSGWNDDVKPIKCTENLTLFNWDSIKKTVDLDMFFSLPEIIGCPDCADGGAEWLEIENFSGEKYKVTFEYGNAPRELKNAVAALRQQYEKGIHCGEL